MAGKLKTKDPTPFIEVLPGYSTNMDYANGEIHWEVKVKNESIIFTYDLHTKFAYYDNFDNEADHGRYYRRIFKPAHLEQAIEDWAFAKENWQI